MFPDYFVSDVPGRSGGREARTPSKVTGLTGLTALGGAARDAAALLSCYAPEACVKRAGLRG